MISKEPFEFSHRTRARSWEALKQEAQTPLNFLIIGGGIVGAGILRELALRQVPRACLIEKEDFASATSGSSSKLIHAGIRYLEQVWLAIKCLNLKLAYQNFKFVLAASRERKILCRLAPGLITPEQIFMVVGKDDSRAPLSIFMGVWLYYLIQIVQGQFYPLPKTYFSTQKIQELEPNLEAARVKAAFSFFDTQTDDARLVVETMRQAVSLGCQALNYVKAVGLKKEGDMWEATLQNTLSGETIQVKAKVVVNAGGPFADEIKHLIHPGHHRRMIDRVAGSHLDIYPAITQRSFYITAGDGRFVFLLKRNEDGLVFTRVGTTEREMNSEESTDHPPATKEEVAYLVNLVNHFFPKAGFQESMIARTDAGIRPLIAQGHRSAFHKLREHRILREGTIFHVLGVKLTDFRRVACELMKKIRWKKLGIAYNPTCNNKPNPLRTTQESKLYLEITPQEYLHQTMIVKWEDFFKRRKGLQPAIWGRFDQPKLKSYFDAMAKEIGWDPSEFKVY